MGGCRDQLNNASVRHMLWQSGLAQGAWPTRSRRMRAEGSAASRTPPRTKVTPGLLVSGRSARVSAAARIRAVIATTITTHSIEKHQCYCYENKQMMLVVILKMIAYVSALARQGASRTNSSPTATPAFAPLATFESISAPAARRRYPCPLSPPRLGHGCGRAAIANVIEH